MAIETSEDVVKGFGIGTFAIFATTLIIALITVPAILISGWVLSIAWNMVMVKAFALPILSIPQAIAINLFTSYLFGRSYTKDERKTWEKVLQPFLGSAFFLLVAYFLSFYL